MINFKKFSENIKKNRLVEYYARQTGPDTDTHYGYGKFVYTILTTKQSNKGGHISFATDGLHFLCDDINELEELKKKYPVGGKYNGYTIVDTYVSRESDGFATR